MAAELGKRFKLDRSQDVCFPLLMTSTVVTTNTSAFPSVDETYAVFVHLNAEKSPLYCYRAILSVFVAERARFTLALRPSMRAEFLLCEFTAKPLGKSVLELHRPREARQAPFI
jgi:hypothetical protein